MNQVVCEYFVVTMGCKTCGVSIIVDGTQEKIDKTIVYCMCLKKCEILSTCTDD